MLRVILLCLISCSFLGLNAQDVKTAEEVQAEKNEEKIKELKGRLKSISIKNDTLTVDRPETLIPRLVRIEQELSTLVSIVDSMQISLDKINEKTANNTALESKLNEVLELLQSGSSVSSKRAASGKKVNREGEFMVVVEAQRTFIAAEKAKVIFEKRYNKEVEIIPNKMKTWYYLVLPETYSYSLVLEQVNKQRVKGIEDAWWLKK